MILIVCIIAAVALTVFAVHFFNDDGIMETLAMLACVLSVFAWIVVLGTGIYTFAVNVCIDGEIVARQQIYDSLVYQVENNLYDNDNDVGKQKLYEKVTDWNIDLAYGKALQHNFWVGIFYPDIYDQFDFIDLSISIERTE